MSQSRQSIENFDRPATDPSRFWELFEVYQPEKMDQLEKLGPIERFSEAVHRVHFCNLGADSFINSNTVMPPKLTLLHLNALEELRRASVPVLELFRRRHVNETKILKFLDKAQIIGSRISPNSIKFAMERLRSRIASGTAIKRNKGPSVSDKLKTYINDNPEFNRLVTIILGGGVHEPTIRQQFYEEFKPARLKTEIGQKAISNITQSKVFKNEIKRYFPIDKGGQR